MEINTAKEGAEIRSGCLPEKPHLPETIAQAVRAKLDKGPGSRYSINEYFLLKSTE